MKLNLMRKLILEIGEVTDMHVELSYTLGVFGNMRMICKFTPKDSKRGFVASFMLPFEMYKASDKVVFDFLKSTFLSIYSDKLTKRYTGEIKWENLKMR